MDMLLYASLKGNNRAKMESLVLSLTSANQYLITYVTALSASPWECHPKAASLELHAQTNKPHQLPLGG